MEEDRAPNTIYCEERLRFCDDPNPCEECTRSLREGEDVSDTQRVLDRCSQIVRHARKAQSYHNDRIQKNHRRLAAGEITSGFFQTRYADLKKQAAYQEGRADVAQEIMDFLAEL